MSLNVQLMGAMGIGDIISRAWRLYILNFKKIILYSLIGTPILVLSQILVNVPSAYAGKPEMIGMFCCCFYPVGFSLLIAGAFIAIFFNFCMVKAFFNILTGQEISFKYILDYSKQRLTYLLKFCLLLVTEIVVFYIIDIFLLTAVIFLTVLIPIIGSSIAGDDNHLLSGVIAVTTCGLFFIVVILFSIFGLIQFLICALQIVIAAVEKTTVFGSFFKSIDIVANNIFRSSVFIFCLGMLWYIIVIFFNTPPLIYSFYEIFKDGFVSASSGTYPVHVLVISTLWGFIVNMLTWPWVISGLTLFYYDTKVRNEGFDLKQAIRIEKETLYPEVTE